MNVNSDGIGLRELVGRKKVEFICGGVVAARQVERRLIMRRQRVEDMVFIYHAYPRNLGSSLQLRGVHQLMSICIEMKYDRYLYGS